MALRPDEVDPARLMSLQLLGAGDMTKVYLSTLHPPRADDDGDNLTEAPGRIVAEKQIDWHEWSMGTLEQRTWTREVEALHTLNHPNVVRLLGIQSDLKPLGLILEFCAGLDLFKLLHGGGAGRVALTWAQQRKMSLDSALAMEHLHSQNPPLLHRDLKSLNLFLDMPLSGPADVPLVKVADFGLARRLPAELGPNGRRRQMTSCVGTLEWMAPEVFCGLEYDEKVDVYSFGIVLHEIMCRAIPFKDVEPRDLKETVLMGARPDVNLMPARCPEVLKDLMKLCWTRSPVKRPGFEKIVHFLRATI